MPTGAVADSIVFRFGCGLADVPTLRLRAFGKEVSFDASITKRTRLNLRRPANAIEMQLEPSGADRLLFGERAMLNAKSYATLLATAVRTNEGAGLTIEEAGRLSGWEDVGEQSRATTLNQILGTTVVARKPGIGYVFSLRPRVELEDGTTPQDLEHWLWPSGRTAQVAVPAEWLFEESRRAIWIANEAMQIHYMNKAMANLFGVPHDKRKESLHDHGLSLGIKLRQLLLAKPSRRPARPSQPGLAPIVGPRDNDALSYPIWQPDVFFEVQELLSREIPKQPWTFAPAHLLHWCTRPAPGTTTWDHMPEIFTLDVRCDSVLDPKGKFRGTIAYIEAYRGHVGRQDHDMLPERIDLRTLTRVTP